MRGGGCTGSASAPAAGMEKLLASLASDTVKQRAAAVDELEVRARALGK